MFKAMQGLKWREITIRFIEPESVRVKARKCSKTFGYEAMGFKNRNSRESKPNKCWETLKVLAIATTTSRTLTDTLPPQTDVKRRVSRLRDVLQEFFGITDDPILYHHTTYKPAFILTAEEHVIKREHNRVRPDDEDEENLDAQMQHPANW